MDGLQEVTDFGMDNIPGMIDLDIGGDMGGDTLGVGLLANMKVSDSNAGREVSFGMGSAPSNVEVGVRMASAQSDTMSFDIPVASSGHETRYNISREAAPMSMDMGAGFSSGADLFTNPQTTSGSGMGINFTPASQQPVIASEDRKKRRDMLTKLNRLGERGYELSRRFTLDDTLEEMEEEYERLSDAKRFTSSLEWQRGALVTLVSGLEMMNDKYDPFDVQLKGWSESVNENIEGYDDIFEELYDKYKGRGGMPPEVRLVWKLATSGFMVHASNSIFKSKKETIEESLRRDPVFMQRVAQATMSNMGAGFANFAAEAGGMPGPSPAAPAPTQSFYNSPQHMAAAAAPPVARREMRGPPNVDDILQQFEQHSDPMTQPAISSAAEINSLASEEIHSQAETIKTAGGTRRGKRKQTTPVGSVYSLNV